MTMTKARAAKIETARKLAIKAGIAWKDVDAFCGGNFYNASAGTLDKLIMRLRRCL